MSAMSDNINKGIEETKHNNNLGEHQASNTNQTPEEIVAELTKILDSMFDPKNLVTNKYLVKRAKQDTTFEIPIEVIYEEFSIKAKTENKELIDKALKQTPSLICVGKDKTDAVKPKKNETKTSITINEIDASKEQVIVQYLNGLEYGQEDIIWKFYSNLNTFEISCRDEDIAHDVFEKLQSNPPQTDSKLNISFGLLNLYISALDFSKRKAKKGLGYQGPPRAFYPNAYPSYPMNFYPQMNYGMYPQFYKPNPYQMMGQDGGNYGKRPYKKSYNSYSNGGYGNGGYSNGNGGYGNNYNNGYNNNRGRGKYNKKGDSPTFNVNETEFPPLNEDNKQQ